MFHCFTGGPDEARRCLDLGAHLSFSGIVTFKGAPEVREAVALCPLDRLLVETDSPYLAPVPHRGRPNQPAFVPLVGEAVADVKGVQLAAVAEATWANAARVYGLPAERRTLGRADGVAPATHSRDRWRFFRPSTGRRGHQGQVEGSRRPPRTVEFSGGDRCLDDMSKVAVVLRDA